MLWEAARARPITSLHPLRMVDPDKVCDYEWVATNCRRYVRRIQRVATRNHPVAEARLHDFYHERDGRWQDENLLVRGSGAVQATSDWHVMQ